LSESIGRKPAKRKDFLKNIRKKSMKLLKKKCEVSEVCRKRKRSAAEKYQKKKCEVSEVYRKKEIRVNEICRKKFRQFLPESE